MIVVLIGGALLLVTGLWGLLFDYRAASTMTIVGYGLCASVGVWAVGVYIIGEVVL